VGLAARMESPISALAPRVLVAFHDFPENGGARIDKFVQLLPRAGLEPVVLTAAENATPESRELLRQGYPPELEVHWASSMAFAPFTPRYLVRARGARFYQLLRLLSAPERFAFIPDHMVRWIPAAIPIARRLAKSGRIDCVFTSSPPESTHLIGLYLQRAWGIPWVADFQDLWTEKGFLCRPVTRLHAAAIRRLESSIFRAADHIIANTPENRNRHLNRFALAPNRVTVIPNGFDRSDLESGQHPVQRDGVFRIGYMGHFDKHGFPWRHFLVALKALADEVGSHSVRLIHCGFRSTEVERYIAANGLTDLVEWRGNLSHRAALNCIASTDLLLNLLYENEYSDSIVNAKLYPYLILNRPILAVGPRLGAMARIVEETRTGTVVSAAGGPGTILAALRHHRAAWIMGNNHLAPDEGQVARYDCVQQTKALAAILWRYSRRTVGTEAAALAVGNA